MHDGELSEKRNKIKFYLIIIKNLHFSMTQPYSIQIICAFGRKYINYTQNIEKITILCYNKSNLYEEVVFDIGTVADE